MKRIKLGNRTILIKVGNVVNRIYEYFKKRLLSMSKYPAFLREKGVTIGTGCEIYKTANFGSEPYLITIGNHVRINAGVLAKYIELISEYADKARVKGIPTKGMTPDEKKSYFLNEVER